MRYSAKLDSDNERASGTRALGFLVGEDELVRVVRHQHSQQEDGKDVEEENSVEGQLYSSRDSLARILCLSDRDTDQFSAQVCESSGNKSRP